MTYIFLYVDNIILTTFSYTLREPNISLLLEFSMKDLRPMNFILDIVATRHSKGLFSSQKKYAYEILVCARMSSFKPCITLIDTKLNLGVTDNTRYEDRFLYHSLADALQHLTFTQPTCQQICLFMHNPMEAQMHIHIRMLSYIQGTQQYGLHIYLSSTTSLILSTYVDWRWYPDTRCSTYGYCVFLDDNLLY